jgi:hypothetical protein
MQVIITTPMEMLKIQMQVSGKTGTICFLEYKLLKGFVDGKFQWNFYTFIRPNQEQLHEMQL